MMKRTWATGGVIGLLAVAAWLASGRAVGQLPDGDGLLARMERAEKRLDLVSSKLKDVSNELKDAHTRLAEVERQGLTSLYFDTRAQGAVDTHRIGNVKSVERIREPAAGQSGIFRVHFARPYTGHQYVAVVSGTGTGTHVTRNVSESIDVVAPMDTQFNLIVCGTPRPPAK